ncbi:MAG TPA: hypothetical protein VN779_18070 [Actinocrinis sp.]|nr:hypothetical protein [Actinocrinis sp.]
MWARQDPEQTVAIRAQPRKSQFPADVAGFAASAREETDPVSSRALIYVG